MKRDKNRKNGPPSREKYEKENPTVSARLPVEKHDKLLSVLRRLCSLPPMHQALSTVTRWSLMGAGLIHFLN